MTNKLTKQEKTNIINSHQQSLEFNKYNLHINLLEENARTEPNQSVVDGYNSQIEEITRQLSALEAELASLPEDN
jgi:hypothetical protein